MLITSIPDEIYKHHITVKSDWARITYIQLTVSTSSVSVHILHQLRLKYHYLYTKQLQCNVMQKKDIATVSRQHKQLQRLYT